VDLEERKRNEVDTSADIIKWMIYGMDGWIGQQFLDQLHEKRPHDLIIRPCSRADDHIGVCRDLDSMKPDRVLSFIGRTHGM